MNERRKPDGVVLLVEDNRELNAANARALKLRGYNVLTAKTLGEARCLLGDNDPDVILLDVMLPDGDGYSFCREIRSRTTSHILFLTAKTEHEDKLRGLNCGGDDYITKPFHPEELMARVDAVMRRRNTTAPANIVAKGSLMLDYVAAQAFIDGKDLLLTQKEFALLLLLAQNEGSAISAPLLYEKVWKMPLSGDRNSIQAIISKLRKKLEPSGYYIRAERGQGYLFTRL